MLFHLGALWRLNDAGLLPRLSRVSSVSGGSMSAGVLGLAWPRLGFDAAGVARAFPTEVVTPLRHLARRTVDVAAGLLGVFGPGTVADRVAGAYDETLYHGATLQDLPDTPRFVINASSLQTGALWRFAKPYAGDYKLGTIRHPRLPLARAVAASSAFPPFLSPMVLRFAVEDYDPTTRGALFSEAIATRVYLTDGGVYDNLGLEPAWKHYRTVLVSDGGGQMAPEERPKTDWARHTRRVLDLVDNQVRSLRKRRVVGSFQLPASDNDFRLGTYWGIRSDPRKYRLADAFIYPRDATMRLANIPTRLAALDELTQERLVNWGFAICDTALRKWVDSALRKPGALPYPGAGV